MTYLICWANNWDVFGKYFVYRRFYQFNLFQIAALFRDFLFCSSVRFNHCSYKVFAVNSWLATHVKRVYHDRKYKMGPCQST